MFVPKQFLCGRILQLKFLVGLYVYVLLNMPFCNWSFYLKKNGVTQKLSTLRQGQVFKTVARCYLKERKRETLESFLHDDVVGNKTAVEISTTVNSKLFVKDEVLKQGKCDPNKSIFC